ncbi:hypothetical protein [Streptomyces sp. NPDC014676]|uniref:MoaF-related domain-containing protein n=1 Tax=Streptomyces sp. NPDC014676 TaxID=3364879 RepID=UPI0036FD977A
MSQERLTNSRYFVDLGRLTMEENHEPAERMTFTVVTGGGMMPDGYVPMVATTAVEIRPDVFRTSWEEESEAGITHLEDSERGEVHSRITLRDGTPLALNGTIKPLD